MCPTRVLVADDNAGYGAVLTRFVGSHHGMRVVGLATDGRQAVLMAGVLLPDVVLMDVCMPDLDGFEATRRLKSSATPPHVVIMTAHRADENRRLAEAAGADAFVMKHEVDQGLVDIINGLMGSEGRFHARGGEGPSCGGDGLA